MAIAAEGRTPVARRIGTWSVIFLILASVIGGLGLIELFNLRRPGARVMRARESEAIRFSRGDVVWVSAPLYTTGLVRDWPPKYYLAPEDEYRGAVSDGRFTGRLRPGVDERLRTLYADAGHPVPPGAYTLVEDGTRGEQRSQSEALILVALVMSALAMAGLAYAMRAPGPRDGDSEIG
jgi:hypothetical protein